MTDEAWIGNDQAGIFRYGKGLPGNATLARGWGEPEPGFVWSEGRAAVLSLPASSGVKKLSATIWGYVHPKIRAQEVLLFVNGTFRGHFEVNTQVAISASLEGDRAKNGYEVVFYLPTAIAPREAEDVPDDRRLGIALTVLKLE